MKSAALFSAVIACFLAGSNGIIHPGDELELEADVGDNVSIPLCTSTMARSDGTSWKFDPGPGSTSVSLVESGIVVANNSDRYTVNNTHLSISSVNLSDTGSYTCADGTGHMAKTHLNIVQKFNEEPKSQYVYLGDEVTFWCGTTYPHPVWWEFLSIGASTRTPIYSNRHMVVRDPDKRFSVKGNSSSGQYPLSIRNVSRSDAGKYFCIDDNGNGRNSMAELVILDRNPICTTNLPGNEAIGENDCKLDPDKVKISCANGYRGNISPKMECRNTGSNALLQSQVVKDTGSFIILTFEIGELSHFSSNSHVCQLMDGVDGDTGHLVYRMENITVLNISNPEYNIGEDWECLLSSSLERTYKWVDETGKILGKKSTLNPLLASGDSKIRCVVTVKIRDKTCDLTGSTLHLIESPKIPHYVALVLLGILLSVVITAIVFHRWWSTNVSSRLPGKRDENKLEKKLPELCEMEHLSKAEVSTDDGSGAQLIVAEPQEV